MYAAKIETGQTFCFALRTVRPRSRFAAVSGPVGVRELAARLIDTFIRVRAKEVALGLDEVGGKALC